MNKVLLSKEQAAALESAKNGCNFDKAAIVRWHADDLWEGDRAALNKLELDALCTALYVGYEVEPGPEEKVFHFYVQVMKFGGHGQADVIKQTLNLLGKEIKGINC